MFSHIINKYKLRISYYKEFLQHDCYVWLVCMKLSSNKQLPKYNVRKPKETWNLFVCSKLSHDKKHSNFAHHYAIMNRFMQRFFFLNYTHLTLYTGCCMMLLSMRMLQFCNSHRKRLHIIHTSTPPENFSHIYTCTTHIRKK